MVREPPTHEDAKSSKSSGARSCSRGLACATCIVAVFVTKLPAYTGLAEPPRPAPSATNAANGVHRSLGGLRICPVARSPLAGRARTAPHLFGQHERPFAGRLGRDRRGGSRRRARGTANRRRPQRGANGQNRAPPRCANSPLPGRRVSGRRRPDNGSVTPRGDHPFA